MLLENVSAALLLDSHYGASEVEPLQRAAKTAGAIKQHLFTALAVTMGAIEGAIMDALKLLWPTGDWLRIAFAAGADLLFDLVHQCRVAIEECPRVLPALAQPQVVGPIHLVHASTPQRTGR